MDERDARSQGWDAGNGSDAEWPRSGVGSIATEAPRQESAPRRALASVGFVLDATRRRRSGRLFLWFLVVAMALGGLGLLLYPVATDMWADRIQNRLEGEFENLQAGGPDTEGNGFEAGAVAQGQALTRLKIPSLGVNVIVVEGISGNALRAGAGHYPRTPLPCEPGNVAIAGHRTGFGEPFRHLDRLSEGDTITLETPFRSCTYRVMGAFDDHSNPWITHAKDWTVVRNTASSVLTLTTCDPPGTSKNRLIVRAELVRGTG